MWMRPENADFSLPQVWFCRNVFDCPESGILKFRFSADEYAVVFLDGKRIAEGPERGSCEQWFMSDVEIEVESGEHCLVFCVNSFGNVRQMAQHTIKAGLWFRETGGDFIDMSKWDCVPMEGCTFFLPYPDFGGSPRVAAGNGYTYGRYRGEGDGWKPVAWFADDRKLNEPVVPHMLFEPERVVHEEGNDFWRFEKYFIGWGHYRFRGFGIVRIRWFENPDPEDDGDLENAGMVEDLIQVDGETEWRDLWFHAGNCVRILHGKCVIVEEVNFHRTGYPWELNVSFDGLEGARRKLAIMSLHTLKCCTRDTFMDCPFYEQLQYVSDTRVQALTLNAVSKDNRLFRKAVMILSCGILENGIMKDRYPDRLSVYAPDGTIPTSCSSVFIPSFSLLFVQMVHDIARLHIDDALVRSLLPKLRSIINFAVSHISEDGVMENVPGWNFIDWHPNWNKGVPPNAETGGCTLNWIFIASLRDMADMERVFGSPEEAEKCLKLAEKQQENVERVFFDSEKGMFAEDKGHSCYSEHAQVFAVIAGERTDVLPVLERGGLDECGICFSFYFLEVCRKYGLKAAFDARTEKYLQFAELNKTATLPENFGTWRSWCHAWSSHFLYFNFAETSIFDRI